MSKWLVRIIAFCAVLGLLTPLEAKTLHVPQEYDSIQKAVDIADKGDSIEVAPGIYYENIKLRDGRSLLGSGADKTIITDDGEGPPDPIVEIGGDCTLSGFTITGARGAGIGHAVMVTRGTSQIVDNVVRDNSYTGIGIHSVSYLADPLVSRNRIYGNGGAGIANMGEFSQAIIRDNDIYSNSNVGIACTDSATSLIENNRIFENGVGIASKEGAKPIIKNNEIIRNKLVGLAILTEAVVVVSKNKIQGNGTVGINLGGESKAWIVANEISDNGTEALSIKGKSKAYVAFNLIVSNVVVALSIRDSQVTAVRNEIHGLDNPAQTVSKDFLEAQGIDIDHEHQSSGFGPGIIDLKNSSLAVGGNKLGGTIETDANSGIVKIHPQELPKSPEDIAMPQYKKLVPAEETSEKQLIPLPDLKLPLVPKAKPFFAGCLGIF